MAESAMRSPAASWLLWPLSGCWEPTPCVGTCRHSGHSTSKVPLMQPRCKCQHASSLLEFPATVLALPGPEEALPLRWPHWQRKSVPILGLHVLARCWVG